MVDVCLLGSGGMVPLPGRWLTSLLYRYDGRMVLVDCGEGTQVPIRLSGFGYKAIDAICFTHYHADHIAGLPGLLLTIGNTGRQEPLKLIGPPGLLAVVKGLMVIAPALPFYLEIYELPYDSPHTLELDGIQISTLPVEHWMPCFAYSFFIRRAGRFDVQKARELSIPVAFWKRLQGGETIDLGDRKITPELVLGAERRGIRVSYSTDLRPCRELELFAADSDLLICEGMHGDDAMLEKTIEKKHMIFSEAAAVARNSGARELWLTHYSPALENPEDYLPFARAVFPNTFCGHDLMVRSLNFTE